MREGPLFAIIGCGNIAPRHAQQIVKQGRLLAVCDSIPQRALDLAKAYHTKAYHSLEELLEKEPEVEVVAICTPNGLHAEHSIRCLEAGKHVLCEKPMAITTQQAKTMMAAAEQSGKKLYTVKQNRFNPPVVLLKQLLDEKKLGDIISFQLNCFWNRPPAYYQSSSWRGTNDLDGGTLFTQFSHFIDLLYWLLGDIETVQGFRKNFLHDETVQFEDTGVAIAWTRQGAIGTIQYTINSYEKNMEGSLAVFGSKGSLRIGGQYLNELDYFEVEGLARPEPFESPSSNLYGYYQGSMSNHDKVYENLVRALSDPGFSFITMEETLKCIEIIEKIYQASPLLK